MGKIIIVLGPTGSGKSRSIKNLDPKSTVIINTLKKDLPFKGSRALYSEVNRNMVAMDTWDKVVPFIQLVSTQAPGVKTLIIDDARFIMEKEFMKRAKEVGYTKFTELAQHFHSIIETSEAARDDLKVVLMLHDDDIVNDKVITGKKAKLVGQMVEAHYNPIEVVSMCLYCCPSFDKNNEPVFQFYTTKALINGVEIPAKTPEEMFDTKTIPNDLALVFKAMDEYYN